MECYCILHMVRWKYHRGIVMYTTSLICTSTIMKDVWIPRNRSNYKKYETCHLHYSNTYVLPGETIAWAHSIFKLMYIIYLSSTNNFRVLFVKVLFKWHKTTHIPFWFVKVSARLIMFVSITTTSTKTTTTSTKPSTSSSSAAITTTSTSSEIVTGWSKGFWQITSKWLSSKSARYQRNVTRNTGLI